MGPGNGTGLTSSYDRLAVSGAAELAGTFSVALFGGFVPVKGDQFTVLTAADGVTSEFTNLDDPLKGNYALHLGTLYAPIGQPDYVAGQLRAVCAHA